MKRMLLVGGLVLALLVAVPRPAAAGIWAWLEEFSGAGPFRGHAVPLITFCGQDGRIQPSPIAMDDKYHTNLRENVKGTAALRDKLRTATDHHDKLLNCFYFDYGWFEASASTRYPTPVLAKLVDFGGTVRISDGLDIGGGAGAIHFAPGRTRLAITPIRVVVRPLLLIVPEHKRVKALGALSVYWKEVFVAGPGGPLTGKDFGVASDAFHSTADIVRSIGVNLDVTAFLPIFGKS